MSLRDRASKVALGTAQVLRAEANQIGILRSVEATESARWLHELADHIVTSAERPDLTQAELLRTRRAAVAGTRSALPKEPGAAAPPPKGRAKNSGQLGAPRKGGGK